MYSTTHEYLQTVASPTRQQYRVGGTIGGAIFSDRNIIEGSLVITDQAADPSDLKPGGVYIGTLSATLTGVNIQRGSWRGQEINFYIELQLLDGSWERVPMKPYTVQKAEHSSEGVTIEAVDSMAKFDVLADFDALNGSPFEILTFLCKRAKVRLGMTQEQVEALTNGTYQLGLYPKNDIETYRDVLYWLSQTLCSFATIDRSGALVLRRYTGSAEFEKRSDVRFEGATYCDFDTSYTGLSVVNIEEETTSYYSVAPDTGLTVNIGSNPFLQYGDNVTRDIIRYNIIKEFEQMRFTPFELETVPDPAVDVGDILAFPDGISNNATGFVMFSELTFKGSLRLEGYGQDPELANSRGKTDKDISGLSKKTDAKSINYYQYTTTERITLGSEPVRVANIRFVTKELADIDTWHEFKILSVLTSQTMHVRANYYLDGNLIDYEPEDTWSEAGNHILGLRYHAKAAAGEVHTWEVYLTAEGGTGTIEPGDVHVVLAGQGLASQKEWDGLIEMNESISVPFTSYMRFNFSDSVDISTQKPMGGTFDEFISLTFGKGLEFNLEDKPSVIMREGAYPVKAEDGRRLITEDGRAIRTEGGTK